MAKITRISEKTENLLNNLHKKLNKSKLAIIEEAINKLSREEFIAQGNRDYARLQSDPVAWQEELEERELWDVTLSDGENE